MRLAIALGVLVGFQACAAAQVSPPVRTREETLKSIQKLTIDGIKLGMTLDELRARHKKADVGPLKVDEKLGGIEIQYVTLKHDDGISADEAVLTFHKGVCTDVRLAYDAGMIVKKFKTHQKMLDFFVRAFGKISDEDWNPKQGERYAKWDVDDIGMYAIVRQLGGDKVAVLWGEKLYERLPKRTDKFTSKQVDDIYQFSYMGVRIGVTGESFIEAYPNAKVTSVKKTGDVVVETLTWSSRNIDEFEVTITDGRVSDLRIDTTGAVKTSGMLSHFTKLFGKDLVDGVDGNRTINVWNLEEIGRYATAEVVGNQGRFCIGKAKQQ